MARIRSIHPGLWTDEAFVSLSDRAALLFIGLLNESDDNGVFEWKPLTIKMRLRPASNEGTAEIEASLAEMVAANIVRAYEVDGRRYGAIRNFVRYQRPKSPKAVHPAPEEILAFVGSDADTQAGPMSFARDVTAADRKRLQRQRERDEARNGHDDTGNCHASAVTDTEVSRQREEGGCNSRGDTPPISPSVERSLPAKPDSDEGFVEFWSIYPKREGGSPKKPALQSYRRALKRGATPSEILRGAEVYASAMARAGKVGTPYVAQAATWLNNDRWADDPGDVQARAPPDSSRSTLATALAALRSGMRTDH